MQSQARTLELRSLILVTIFMVSMLLIGYTFLSELVSDVFTSPPVMDDIKEIGFNIKNIKVENHPR